MSKSKVLIVFATLTVGVALSLFASELSAATLTEQQVRNICGSNLQSGSAGGSTAMGCEKKCGTKLCTYGCTTSKGKQRCDGVVLSGKKGTKQTGGRQDIAPSRAR